MYSDAEVYRRFLDGDETAFEEIINEYRNGLIFFINRYINDIGLAEDVSIDVFTELYIHKSRYNFNSSLKTYLYMIGRSRALNVLRHRRRHPESSLSDIEKELRDEHMLEDIMLQSERKRIVNTALLRLPENMRIAVHLVYFDGLAYEEAAKVMKKSRKQIDNLLYRAKNMLREIIGKDGEMLI